MTQLLRHLLAGVSTGILLGFVVGWLLLARNPLGSAADRAVLLAVALLVYALVLVVPVALALAVLERLRPVWLARLRALLPKPWILVLAAVVLFGAAVALTSPDVPRTSGRAADLGAGFEAVKTVVAEPPDRKVALLGFDGVDPGLLTVLAERGEMPRFQELLANGALSRLETLKVGLSPPIWTTLATGVDPTVHAIHDFVVRRLWPTGLDLAAVRRYPRGFGAATLLGWLAKKTPLVEEALITPRDRRAPPIWSLASLAGLPTCVIDWMGSWPSEPVTGTSVSDRAFVAWNLGALSFASGETGDGKVPLRLRKHGEEEEGSELPALCHPEPLCRSYFPPSAGEREVRPTLDTAQFHTDENRFYLTTAERLLPATECRFFAFYSHLPDFVNHRVNPKELEAALAGSYESEHGRALLEAYREIDRTLGVLLDHLGPETSVVIVSDHGVEIVGKGARRRVSHSAGPDGVFLFRPSSRATGTYQAPARVSVYDVAPTVLALAGLPLAASMPGRQVEPAVILELGRLERRAIDADRLAEATAEAAQSMAIDPQVEEELRERLRSLGYIE